MRATHHVNGLNHHVQGAADIFIDTSLMVEQGSGFQGGEMEWAARAVKGQGYRSNTAYNTRGRVLRSTPKISPKNSPYRLSGNGDGVALFTGASKQRALTKRTHCEALTVVLERASFSPGRRAPARRRTLTQSTLLRGTPGAVCPCARFISLFNTGCVVSCSRTICLAPTADPPRSLLPACSP